LCTRSIWPRQSSKCIVWTGVRITPNEKKETHFVNKEGQNLEKNVSVFGFKY